MDCDKSKEEMLNYLIKGCTFCPLLDVDEECELDETKNSCRECKYNIEIKNLKEELNYG